ncbi:MULTISPECIES: RidA family protein [Paraburkholderia]|uniref:hypothetical protein n=1 Tax=Paraburkholderia TaxID=1822464 RepID=UPI0038B9898F
MTMQMLEVHEKPDRLLEVDGTDKSRVLGANVWLADIVTLGASAVALVERKLPGNETSFGNDGLSQRKSVSVRARYAAGIRVQPFA